MIKFWNWIVRCFFCRPEGIVPPVVSEKKKEIPESYWEDRWTK